MPNQKIENLLNLALAATPEEREKSLNLDVGYEPIEQTWQVIIKYSGSLEPLRAIGIEIQELLNEYAILQVTESELLRLTEFPQIEYIEKPKRLFFQRTNGLQVSCITSLQQGVGSTGTLHGKGTLVALLDSGIDVTNGEFRREDGTTRIFRLWDQKQGREYTQEEINQVLGEPSNMTSSFMSRDTSGHGTAVAGIAAGNGGAAPDSELVVVKLGAPRQEDFPRTTELMTGLDYVMRTALEAQRPVAVNISIGNTYGAHNGTSLLERFIDDMSNYWKCVICVGSGNEGNTAGHTSGVLVEGQRETVELAVQENETTLSLQIWKYYQDQVDISIVSPSGVQVGLLQQRLGPQRFTIGGTELLLYYGEPSPYSVMQEIYIEFLPRETYVTSGVWQVVLYGQDIRVGQYEMWLPSYSVLNPGTDFLIPTEATTLTIPSTASRVITVGAYNALTLTYADFSGRGKRITGPSNERMLAEIQKPDLVAPGVNVRTTAVGGGEVMASGTSFATPFVTGAASLLMEWGIVQKNDEFLYGEKVKAYLQKGARPLPGFDEYPNNQVGWGALCVRDSLP